MSKVSMIHCYRVFLRHFIVSRRRLPMPGAPFHLSLLDLSIDALAGGSAADQAIAQIMKDNHEFAALGAVGTEMLRYRPVAKDAVDKIETADLNTLPQADQQALIQAIFPNPEMAAYAVAYRQILPFYKEITEIQQTLEDLATAAENEDVDALKALESDAQGLQAKFQNLQGLTDAITKTYSAGALGAIGGRPPIQATPSLPAATWRGWEYMRWKATGDFAAELLKQADGTGDDQLRAYAYGYMTHVGGAAIGEPFCNSITGGPYRTHWWRNKYVRNHVDAWTHGRYQTPATMAGDTPTPAYADWTSLCGAMLDTMVDIDGVTGADAVDAVINDAMPATPRFDKVSALLKNTVANVYGGLGQFQAPPVAISDERALREAYVGLLSVLHFMTGESPLCFKPLGPPPPGSETPPDWYGSGGSGTTPPNPSPGGGGSSGGSVAATITAIIAAILAVLAVVFASLILAAAAAVAAIVAIITLLVAPGGPEWEELRTNIYWMRMQLQQALIALQDALVTGGLGYPQPIRLGTAPAGPNDPWQPVADQDGVALTRSREGRYPFRMQGLPPQNGQPAVPPDAGYLRDPTDDPELPATRSLFEQQNYADAIIDGAGLANGGMMTDLGLFPTRDQNFGGALENALDIIRGAAQGLPSYNLDGDRGYGWKTWRPQLGTAPADATQPVQEVPE
ncbi:hypothetical protein [Roseivivax sp. CAU 1753]